MVDNDFVERLKCKYFFENINLEKFAELLYDLSLTEEDVKAKELYRKRAFEIFRYLENSGYEFSFNTYCIIRELGN